MDYYKIGQQIRKYRKAHNLSQEQLAEMIGISVTHMSHIETGNTKLSLPVFVKVAQVLEVQTDDLLSESTTARSNHYNDIFDILDTCTSTQVKVISDMIKALKVSLDKHENQW